MPHAHRADAEWTPSRLVAWAATPGPATAELVTAILATKPHLEQGYRACLGLMRLGKAHGAARLEAAAARATWLGAASYRTAQNMLASGLDRVPLTAGPAPARAPPVHLDIRGSGARMLAHATVDKLSALRLRALAEAFQRQLGAPEFADLSFEDRVGRLVDAEWTHREQRKLQRRLRCSPLCSAPASPIGRMRWPELLGRLGPAPLTCDPAKG
jgi:IstB-like ATP binding protein